VERKDGALPVNPDWTDQGVELKQVAKFRDFGQNSTSLGFVFRPEGDWGITVGVLPAALAFVRDSPIVQNANRRSWRLDAAPDALRAVPTLASLLTPGVGLGLASRPETSPRFSRFVDVGRRAGLSHPCVYGSPSQATYILENMGPGAPFLTTPTMVGSTSLRSTGGG